ncbi:MAG: hypothetical protein QE263_07555 [Vampirovibrionales bacterium]|jgi:hypothetical protein|nr:hypothetical protein [Vampirovibrionales bacterium]
MTSTIIEVASDLNEGVENRYQLVLEVSESAKKLRDEHRRHNQEDPFTTTTISTDKVIYQSIIMKASEIDLGDGLIG